MAGDDHDPAAAASDALSLHTIAEQDAYATEQEDADFALALQLEEEESQAFIASRSQHQSDTGNDSQTPPFEPYRDDPDASTDDPNEPPPPYRDDPDAVQDEEDENIEAQHTGASTRRRRFCIPKPTFKTTYLKAAGRNLKKLPLCGLTAIALFLGVILGSMFLIMHLFRSTPKELAWRASGSLNYDLKLSKLYPALEANASEECKTMWEKYASKLYCQEQILSTAWDDSNPEDVKKSKVDPWAYSDWVCFSGCSSSISGLRNPMSNGCYRHTDRFDIESYGKDGKQYFEKDTLPEGPMEVARILQERYDRLCALPPAGHKQSEWGTCAADVWMKWSVVDGRNERTLNSLENFVEATNVKAVIPGGLKTGAVKIIKEEKKYEVQEPERRVGPGVGETDCGFCTGDWLERKMRSFEYGALINPKTGEAFGLSEFNEYMTNIIKRCEERLADGILSRVHDRWEKYGWWCRGRPCNEDKKVTDEVRTVLHGMQRDDWPLPELRKMANQRNAPKNALNALHDGLLSLPHSIWFNDDVAIREIIPYSYRVHTLCSESNRNAIERVQRLHGAEFNATEQPKYMMFRTWDLAREQVEQICLNTRPNLIVKQGTVYCAPGYAAIGHPEFIFSDQEPSKGAIVKAFSTALDKLDAKLPYFVPRPRDEEAQRILGRTVLESVCNGCTGELLVGRNPDWRDRVAKFLHDDGVNATEYTGVAKKWFTTCSKMVGHELSREQKKIIWERIGLEPDN